MAMEQIGKTVDLFNADSIPPCFRFLPNVQKIQVTNRINDNYDGVFVLECNGLRRSGLEGLDRFFVVNIDHHPNTPAFGNLNWMDPTAAAVGEMIYDLIKGFSASVTSDISTNLYVAIMTDTGSFQFPNTRPRTFEIAGDLVKKGADPSAIAQAVYMNQSHSKLCLLSALLNNIELYSNQRIAIITLTQSMLNDLGASLLDVEGLVNYPLSIEGVLLAGFIREESEKYYRVSLRSKGQFDVSSVAQLFGGGGHKNAAGLSLEGRLKEIRSILVKKLEKLLD